MASAALSAPGLLPRLHHHRTRSRVIERRAIGISPRLARVHLCHPCSFVTESSMCSAWQAFLSLVCVHALLSSPPTPSLGKREHPLSPSSLSPSPTSLQVIPAVSSLLYCPTSYCPAHPRQGGCIHTQQVCSTSPAPNTGLAHSRSHASN